MKYLNYYSILLLALFVVGNTFIGCVAAADDADQNIDVKLDSLFELKLPEYPQTDDKIYHWQPTYDNEDILAYNSMDNDNWCFKAIKKGKTVMIMQLYEFDEYNQRGKHIKTVTYTINISK